MRACFSEGCSCIMLQRSPGASVRDEGEDEETLCLLRLLQVKAAAPWVMRLSRTRTQAAHSGSTRECQCPALGLFARFRFRRISLPKLEHTNVAACGADAAGQEEEKKSVEHEAPYHFPEVKTGWNMQ